MFNICKIKDSSIKYWKNMQVESVSINIKKYSKISFLGILASVALHLYLSSLLVEKPKQFLDDNNQVTEIPIMFVKPIFEESNEEEHLVKVNSKDSIPEKTLKVNENSSYKLSNLLEQTNAALKDMASKKENTKQKDYETLVSAWIAKKMRQQYFEIPINIKNIVVRVMLDASGNLIYAEVHTSSGEKYIDEMIIEVIEHSSPFPKSSNGEARDLLIPIIFH